MFNGFFPKCLFALIIIVLSLQISKVECWKTKKRRWTKNLPKGVEPSANCNQCESSIKFLSEESKKYLVGTKIPGMPFKTKNSWAGDIHFPDTETTKDASLFFWFWSQDSKESGDDLVIYLNGGPGCSSMLSLFEETGPFIIQDGKFIPNPYSWTLAANMLYINQPVGVAFTLGKGDYQNEFQISEQFALWFIEFLKVFPELSKKRLWITGESYAGYYIPFIFQALNQKSLGGNLKGGLLIDPSITQEDVQFSIPAYKFAKDHQSVLKLTDQDMAIIKNESDSCQLTTFVDQYLKYPPKGRMPSPNHNCDPFSAYIDLAEKRNKNFNMYNILKPPEGLDDKSTLISIFFNDPKVQSYINAPKGEYLNCVHIFGKGEDQTLPPDQIPNYHESYLAKMIEQSDRFIIMHGLLDGLLISEGNKIALQNLSWNNGQGFDDPPNIVLYDMEGKETARGTNEERSLTFVEVPNSGHMIPKDCPSFGLSAILHLLGKRDWRKRS